MPPPLRPPPADSLQPSNKFHSMPTAMAAFFHRISNSRNLISLCKITGNLSSLSNPINRKPLCNSFQVDANRVSVSTNDLTTTMDVIVRRSIATPAEAVAGFDEMVAGTRRRYYMLGGKGGVGKTSCASSLAVKFANHGHPTIIVSTDPAHSLSDSFDQDFSGGELVPVQGLDSPLFALEINPDKRREEFRIAGEKHSSSGVKEFMGSMGLGQLAEQVGELKFEELLDTPPPGLDEAIAIYKVVQFLELQEYSMITRIVFDTAPTGHTLRLLSLPDFMDSFIGKMMKLKQKIVSATSAVKAFLGKEDKQRVDASDKLEQLKERMAKVQELFRDSETTEFIIVSIPTVMAAKETSRLCASLKKENVPVQRLILNQVLPPSASDCKFCAMKRKDQARAIDVIRSDAELSSLRLVQVPQFDAEIMGIPALRFMGDLVWK